MRWISVVVFPEPAPACTSSGLSRDACTTANCCVMRRGAGRAEGTAAQPVAAGGGAGPACAAPARNRIAAPFGCDLQNSGKSRCQRAALANSFRPRLSEAERPRTGSQIMCAYGASIAPGSQVVGQFSPEHSHIREGLGGSTYAKFKEQGSR